VDWYINALSQTSQTTQVIVSIAIMLTFGFLLTRLTKLIKLPNVTGYILAGIIIGPYCLNLIPLNIISGLDFISDIALAFIAFSVGEYFKFSSIKKNGFKVFALTLFEGLIASLLVFVVMYFALGLSLTFSIILAALASATAPASTIMTIKQKKAKGEFVDTLLQVITYDNFVSLILFSVALSLTLATSSTEAVSFGVIMLPILKNIGAIAIGVALGFILKLLMQFKHGSDNRLIIILCILFLFCGICSLLDVSPLLGCIAIGMIYTNFAKEEKLFLQVNYFTPPIMLLFFVTSGLSFNFSALFTSSSIIGNIPLVVIGLVYLIIRFIGKYAGSYLGATTLKCSKNIRNYLGLGLIPQAGVAIGLAALGARTIGGEIGDALVTVILTASILYEIIGPICANISLYLSKSYPSKLEELVPTNEITSKEEKTEVQLLIERIQMIEQQNKNKLNELSQEEAAFNEASEEYLEAFYNEIKIKRNRRNRF